MLTSLSLRLLVTAAIAVSLVVSIPTPVDAGHRANTYCSDSGDICQSTAKVDGVRKLRISLAAKYFSRYRLCVLAPDDSRTCKTFQIQKQGDFFGDTVRWDTRFPDEGSGAYTVIWKMTSGDRVGKKLGFHTSD